MVYLLDILSRWSNCPEHSQKIELNLGMPLFLSAFLLLPIIDQGFIV